MKRFFTYFLALVLISQCLLLAGCGNAEVTDEGFYDPKTDTHYVYCTPMKLYPINRVEDEYLTVKYDDGREVVFYGVQFEDPKKFLCYKDSGYYFLAMNAELEEPSVMEFNPIAASIYGSSNITYITSFYADNEYLPDDKKEHNPTEDTWLCKMVAEYITNGENVTIASRAEDLTDLQYIHLLSQDYPGLYYQISFFGYEGRYYLRDSSINKTVVCPRDIILRLT